MGYREPSIELAILTWKRISVPFHLLRSEVSAKIHPPAASNVIEGLSIPSNAFYLVGVVPNAQEGSGREGFRKSQDYMVEMKEMPLPDPSRQFEAWWGLEGTFLSTI